jgi:hypothetical protein
MDEGKKTVFCHPPYWSGAMLLEAGEVVRASSTPLWDPEHPVRALLSAMNLRSHLEPWFTHPSSPRSHTLFIKPAAQRHEQLVGVGEQAVGLVRHDESGGDGQGKYAEEATGRRGVESYAQVTPSGQSEERASRSGPRGVVTPLTLSGQEVPVRCVVQLDHLLRAEGERKQWHRKIRLKKVRKVTTTEWVPANRVPPCISRPKKLRMRRDEKRGCPTGVVTVLAKFHKMSIGEDGRTLTGVRGRRSRNCGVSARVQGIMTTGGGAEKRIEVLVEECGQDAGTETSCVLAGDFRGRWSQAAVADKEPPDPP